MRLPKILFAALSMAFPGSLLAQDFFSSEPAERLFSFGVRLGVNSSNRTFGKDYFKQWNINSWGTGVNAGVVIDLNMKDFFAIQPGFFFESRSGNYAYAQDYYENGEIQKFTQMGHYRTYNFTVPVMASFRFNVTDALRWNVEAGPYAQFKLHASDNDKITVIDPQPTTTSPLYTEAAKSNFLDFGIKMGTGLTLNRKYSFNVHYLAGTSNVWKNPHEGGRNKAWVFSLGYDF
ncbi:MAG: PorT family protein [Muribaculaceae bacterium]|nr:PorT family protein [Muribaculaceae bacterium]